MGCISPWSSSYSLKPTRKSNPCRLISAARTPLIPLLRDVVVEPRGRPLLWAIEFALDPRGRSLQSAVPALWAKVAVEVLPSALSSLRCALLPRDTMVRVLLPAFMGSPGAWRLFPGCAIRCLSPFRASCPLLRRRHLSHGEPSCGRSISHAKHSIGNLRLPQTSFSDEG